MEREDCIVKFNLLQMEKIQFFRMIYKYLLGISEHLTSFTGNLVSLATVSNEKLRSVDFREKVI